MRRYRIYLTVVICAVGGFLVGCGVVKGIMGEPATRPAAAEPAAPGAAQIAPAETADAIDAAAGNVGVILGAFGVPLAGAIGMAWSRMRLARRATELIGSVQEGRRALEEPERVKLDAVLSEQSRELQDYVRAVKRREKIKKVT